MYLNVLTLVIVFLSSIANLILNFKNFTHIDFLERDGRYVLDPITNSP